MSEHGGETSDQSEQPTPQGQEGEWSSPTAGPPPASDSTGVYGAASWQGVDDGAAAGQQPEGPATAVYGGAAAAPQWAAPGDSSSPQPTAVQPMPGQPAPPQGAPHWAPTGPPPGSPPTQAYPQVQPAAAPGYGVPQQAPTAPAQQLAPAAPSRGRHWNLWAGIPAAAAAFALGYLWRLLKINTSAFDVPVRQQFSIGLQAAAVVVGLLTLVALAAKKRALAAPLAFLLGGVLLADVVYGWYLQMDAMFGFDADFLFDSLIPVTMPLVVLALATIVAALLMRVDGQRR